MNSLVRQIQGECPTVGLGKEMNGKIEGALKEIAAKIGETYVEKW